MLHHILVKWNDQVTDKAAIIPQIQAVYSDACDIPGVHAVYFKPNVIDRPNRYDLLIQLDLDQEALPTWDASDIHKRWKDEFGALIEKKAIFDCD